MPRTEKPPLFWDGSVEEHVRKVSLIVRELLSGKSNNVSVVTLVPNETLTNLEDRRYSMDTVVNLTPKTASAAAALASGTLWVEATNGRITIHHDSQPDTDRSFGAVFVG